MTTYFLILAGFCLLLAGGEGTVRGSVLLAKTVGISPMIIGLIVVGFGTSLPELLVGIKAAVINAPGLVVGNVLGSNVANLLLILGAAIVVTPFSLRPSIIWFDALAIMLATLLFFFFAFAGQLAPWKGLVLLIFMLVFVALTLRRNLKNKNNRPDKPNEINVETTLFSKEYRSTTLSLWVSNRPIMSSATFIVTGIIIMVSGAELLVDSATALAVEFGVPNEIIGLTVIAIGTSLPELATAIVAAYKKHPDLCVGNVVGSNIFNLCGIAGIIALVTPLPISEAIKNFDLLVLLTATGCIFFFLVSGLRLPRLFGMTLIGFYVVYIVAQYVGINAAIT